MKRFHYEAHDQLRRHLADFVDAYKFARRLKTLKQAHALQIYLQGMNKQRKTRSADVLKLRHRLVTEMRPKRQVGC